MPYIKQAIRDGLNSGLLSPETVGELNYALTQVVLKYLNTHGECYKTYNDILGAIEGCKLELYRRKIAPYEDLKIKENSDVY